VTSRDVVLALTISELALAAGATPHPERTSVLELGLDSADEAEIRPPRLASPRCLPPTPGHRC
jgi:4a-hydroxytetrahydrobiopterin dehydratase